MAKVSSKKDVYVFSYSQIVKTDKLEAIKNFAEKTNLSIEVIQQLATQDKNVGGNIYKYMINDMSSKEFHSASNEIFISRKGSSLDDQTFDNCWNAMCMLEPETFAELHRLQAKYEFIIHAIGRTNETQHKYIQDKVQKFDLKPNIDYTTSFEAKTLDIGKLEQSARACYSEEEYQIIFYNEEPDKDAVSILANIYEPHVDNI